MGHRSFECRVKVENQSSRKVVCYACNQPGHLATDCPEKANKEKPHKSGGGGKKSETPLRTNIVSTRGDIVTIKGKLNGLDVEFLPDTGAEVTVVSRKFVCEAQFSDQFVTIEGATGTPERTPLDTVNLEVLGESFSKQVAVSSSMDKSCRVLYSIPLGGKLPEILFKSAREQERHAKCEASPNGRE